MNRKANEHLRRQKLVRYLVIIFSLVVFVAWLSWVFKGNLISQGTVQKTELFDSLKTASQQTRDEINKFKDQTEAQVNIINERAALQADVIERLGDRLTATSSEEITATSTATTTQE